MITRQQHSKLMQEYHRSGQIGRAAQRAGMDRKTAAYYISHGVSPDERRRPRHWRTREDPLAAVWPQAQRWLESAPELEAKALFEHLVAKGDPALAGTALRSFYRRVSSWKRAYGPPKEVFFPQVRQPGASLQLDWTHVEDLGVTIAGEPAPALLCHSVLPFSNWEWAVPCRSESMLSLKSGLQGALWALGAVPPTLQTDHSSTATHQLKRGAAERGFNTEYLALCAHLGIKPTTINKACPNENGDVESSHGHLKRRLKAHLILRCSSAFPDEAAWAVFVAGVCMGANALRAAKVAQELPLLRALPATRYPAAETMSVRVSCYATIRVKHCAYSVPARLIGAIVEVAVSETDVAVLHERQEVVRYPRSAGQQPRIDYRHVIASLVRKPGAFADYLYREEMFPRPVFRQAYDRLQTADPRKADANYLRVLLLAAQTDEETVAHRLGELLRGGELPRAEAVQAGLSQPATDTASAVTAFTPELKSYDALLVEAGA